MKKSKFLVGGAAVMMMAMAMIACSGSADDDSDSGIDTSGSGESSGSVTQNTYDLSSFSTSDFNFAVELSDDDKTQYGATAATVVANDSDFVENSTFGSTLTVTYSGTSASVSGTVSGVTVTTDGAHVTVNSTAKGVAYVLKGTTTNGQFKIYSSNKYKLTLSNVSITNTTGSAIDSQSKKHAYIVVSGDNTLTDASTYTATPSKEDEKGTLFCEGETVFSGSGTLKVTGNCKHAIAVDNFLRFVGSQDITIPSAKSDGVHADSVIVNAGALTVASTGDAVQSESSFAMTGGFIKAITTQQKCHGITADGNVAISGGAVQASVSGNASKGITADGTMNISGGKMTLLTSGAAYYDTTDKDVSGCAGLKSDGNMTISGGTILVKSTGIGGKGLSTDGVYTQTGGTVKAMTTGKKYTYSSSLDTSAKGLKADGKMVMSGGTLIVKATGGEGSEGIETKNTLTVDGGTIASYSYDDSINASGNITINNGYVYGQGTNNDGIDSNGNIYINGGVVIGFGASAPEEGIDYIENGTMVINGGYVIGAGGTSSSTPSTSSTQCSVLFSASLTSGNLLSIVSSDNKGILTFANNNSYNSLAVLVSCPKFTKGDSYTIYMGGAVTGGTNFFGLNSGGTYSGGTSAGTFTISSVVTGSGTGMGGGGMGGGGTAPGGGGWH